MYCIIINHNVCFDLFFRKENAIIIGGWPISHEHGHAPNQYPSVAYDYDSMVWCVSRAGPIPTWQNVFKIFKDLSLFLTIFVIYYLYVVIGYVLARLEDMDWDAYRVMLAALCIACNMPCTYDTKTGIGRGIYSAALWTALLIYTHIVCFYVVVINLVFYQPQVGSWNDIEYGNLQLAIDEPTAELFATSQMVILICCL